MKTTTPPTITKSITITNSAVTTPPIRKRSSQRCDKGSVLIADGSRGNIGAPALTGLAANRAGAYLSFTGKAGKDHSDERYDQRSCRNHDDKFDDSIRHIQRPKDIGRQDSRSSFAHVLCDGSPLTLSVRNNSRNDYDFTTKRYGTEIIMSKG